MSQFLMESKPQSGLTSKVRLNNGVEMPVLGLGTWQTPDGNAAYQAVRDALEIGYRLIDTAAAYGNEASVGRAVRESGLPRKEVFVTTKLWNDRHGYDECLRACEESLKRLGLDYVDLYLIHWPSGGRRKETWEAMIKLMEDGKCRSIGVSNFTIMHLEEILATSDVVPMVNQVEFTPFLYQRELLSYCRSHTIQVEAYSPLTHGRSLGEEPIASIARRYGKTTAQLLLRWDIQHGLVTIPKSTHRARIEENAQVFDFALSDEDMRRLDSLDRNMRTTTWDPSTIP
jgi:diketogulonate reductase-like aldo/keto reductase